MTGDYDEVHAAAIAKATGLTPAAALTRVRRLTGPDSDRSRLVAWVAIAARPAGKGRSGGVEAADEAFGITAGAKHG